MTFPNQASYGPDQQQRDDKSVVETTTECKKPSLVTIGKATAMTTEWKSDCQTIEMEHKFQSMTTAHSPTHEQTTALQSLATKRESLVHIEKKCKRLLDVRTAQQHERYQQIQLNPRDLIDSKTSQTSMAFPRMSPYAKEYPSCNCPSKKRSGLSKSSRKLMHDWFDHNLHHPYPTEQEKRWLAEKGGITLEQVSNWFINTRGRKWKPMLNRLIAEKQANDSKEKADIVD